MSKTTILVLDCEVYPNFTLVAFKDINTDKVVTISMLEGEPLSESDINLLSKIMSSYTTFGFNSLNYDLPIIHGMLEGWNSHTIYMLSMDIISNGAPQWKTYKEYGFFDSWNHYDIMETAPAVKTGLKTYGARLNTKWLQELPIDPHKPLTDEEKALITEYCVNDLNVTIELHNAIQDELELRLLMGERYSMDLRSKSRAQVAEIVITKLVEEMTTRETVRRDVDSVKPFKYKAPDFIKFKSKNLKKLLEGLETYEFSLDNGKIRLPDALQNKAIQIGYTSYKLGVGGLHSQEEKVNVIPNENELLIDADVASYYPSIILELGLYPDNLGVAFLKVYEALVKERLEAKGSGDYKVSDVLKIVINAAFGKFGSQYSKLFAPELLIAITITGQLSLLMLIEELESRGMSVVSANTDGIVTLLDKQSLIYYDEACFHWELVTGFNLEFTQYRALYSMNVNNYLAIKVDNTYKGKGCFAKPSLLKHPIVPICTEAVINYLVSNKPIEDTINNCKDFNKFVTVRGAKSGAKFIPFMAMTTDDNNGYLGKLVRWYYSPNGGTIVTYDNEYTVSEAQGCIPVQTLPDELPNDINYKWYIYNSEKMLKNLGVDYVRE